MEGEDTRTKASCWGEVDHRFSSLVGVAEKEEESGESMLGGQAGPKALNAVSRDAASFPFDKQQSVSEGLLFQAVHHQSSVFGSSVCQKGLGSA